MKTLQSVFLFFLLLTAQDTYCQTFAEFIAKLNPMTAAHQHVSPSMGSMVVVPGSGYDQNHHRIFYSGRNNMQHWTFYTVDVVTGSVLHQPVQTGPTTHYAAGLQYDNSVDTLYGLFSNGTTMPATFSYSWIDPVTGVMSIKNPVGNINYSDGYHTGLDEINQRYFFIGMDANQQTRLYVLHSRTGALINSFPVPYIVKDMHFNKGDHHLYCMIDSATWGYTALDTIEVLTGTFHRAYNFDRMYGVSGRETTSMNNVTGHYTFVGRTYDPQIMDLRDTLYTMDLQTLSIINRVEHPYDVMGQSANEENIIGFQYDDSLNTIYGIHWGFNDDPLSANGTAANTSFDMYPNPASDNVRITLQEHYARISVTITDAAGRRVLSSEAEVTQQLEMDCSGLGRGIYFVSIIGDGENCGTRKLIIE